MAWGRIAQAALIVALTAGATAPATAQVLGKRGQGQSGAERGIAGSGADGGPPSTTDARYDAGMAAIRAGDPDRAIALMRPVLADFERRYARETRQAYCALTPAQAAAYRADAARTRRAVVAVDAAWCRAEYVTGYALIDLDRLPEALSAFRRLVGLAPQNARYLNELGYILMKQKKWQEALAVYRRSDAAADLSPDRVTEERCLALKGIGYNLVELGDYDAAETAYRTCLAIDPDDPDASREIDYIRQQRKLMI